MPGSETGPQKKERTRRQRPETLLAFDPKQNVPDPVLNAIVNEWLIPTLADQFLRERGVTRQSLLARYRTLE